MILDDQKPRLASIWENAFVKQTCRMLCVLAGYTRPSSSLRTMFAMLSDPLWITDVSKVERFHTLHIGKTCQLHRRFESIKASKMKKKTSNFGESKKVRCTVYSTCICIFSSKPRPEPAKPGIPNSGAIACEAV